MHLTELGHIVETMELSFKQGQSIFLYHSQEYVLIAGIFNKCYTDNMIRFIMTSLVTDQGYIR